MKKKEIGIYHVKAEKWEMTDFELIDKYKEHGFDNVCFYANYQPVELVSSCVKYAREIGLNVNTIHGPLKNNSLIWSEDFEEYVNFLKDYIKMCGELKIKYFVLHTAGKDCPLFTNSGLENFKELVELAKSLGVVILAENLRTVDHLIFLTEQIKSKNFQICLDFGHANVWCYDAPHFIKKFKKHIKAVHIHDNFGPNAGDQHLIPFTGTIDWKFVIPLLFKYYRGPITLELDNFKTEEFKYDNIDEYLSDAYKSAKELWELV